ncbi:MAG: class I SAM-dependent methyltransferase [Anaerolineae bacterium]|nr:class I SAM-dependent methyltransferase [Anaerolineae bacterium]
MENEVIQKLLMLNQKFYDGLAESFAESRSQPQPGFFRIMDELPDPCHYFLDVGCGEGRLGRFLLARGKIRWYTGVDFSGELLAKAQAITMGDFHQRDLSRPGSLYGLGGYDCVACLAAMQHLPGQTSRVNLLNEMKLCLNPDGRIIISNWQFLDSERQRRKIVAWDKVDIDENDVEAKDFLLTWRRDGFGLRYVSMIDEAETAVLAEAAGLKIINQFRSDGKEGNLSLYTILQSPLNN